MNSFSSSPTDFDKKALTLFRKQATENDFYRRFLEILKVQPQNIDQVSNIPFLPVQLFKHNEIKTGDWLEQNVFLSSGTTLHTRSRHFVKDEQKYLRNAATGFKEVFGNPSEWNIIACLPGYSDNPSSSLISMVHYLIGLSGNIQSGFIPFEHETIKHKLKECIKSSKKTMLIGVAFALADFALCNKVEYADLYILETGGMKGRGEDFTRKALHTLLSDSFGTAHIFSEYGMTELFSQAYTMAGTDRFKCMPSMKILVKDINDPMEIKRNGRYGAIHIIDLANEDTCAFIATQDLGLLHDDGSFEVIGRIDSADLRGCNLLYIAP